MGMRRFGVPCIRSPLRQFKFEPEELRRASRRAHHRVHKTRGGIAGAFAGMSQSDQVWRSVLTCSAVGDVRVRERRIAPVATRYVRASDAEFGFVPTRNSVRLPLKSPSGLAVGCAEFSGASRASCSPDASAARKPGSPDDRRPRTPGSVAKDNPKKKLYGTTMKKRQTRGPSGPSDPLIDSRKQTMNIKHHIYIS